MAKRKAWFRIFSLLVLMVWVAPAPLLHVYLHNQITMVKQRVEKHLQNTDNEQLVTLTFTYQQARTLLRWEHAKEFEYQGEMYDIVSLQWHGNSVTFRCWHDTKETRLNKQLRHVLAQQNPLNQHQKDAQKRLFDSLKHLLFIPVCLNFVPENLLTANILCYTPYYTNNSIRPPAPPPKHC